MIIKSSFEVGSVANIIFKIFKALKNIDKMFNHLCQERDLHPRSLAAPLLQRGVFDYSTILALRLTQGKL